MLISYLIAFLLSWLSSAVFDAWPIEPLLVPLSSSPSLTTSNLRFCERLPEGVAVTGDAGGCLAEDECFDRLGAEEDGGRDVVEDAVGGVDTVVALAVVRTVAVEVVTWDGGLGGN